MGYAFLGTRCKSQQPFDLVEADVSIIQWSSNDGRAIPLLYWQLPTKKHERCVLLNAPGIAGDTKTVTFSIQDKLLKARGLEFDIVREFNSDGKFALESKKNASAFQRRDYVAGGSLTDALWRTLVLNRADTDAIPAPPSWEILFYRFVARSTGSSTVHQWYNANKHFRLGGSTIEEIARQWWMPTVEQAVIPDEDFSRFSSAFTIANGYRKLVSTKKDYLCLVPPDARAGDVVAILAGCSVPVLLRLAVEGSFYEFLGTCYVHGIMHGEATKDMDADDVSLKEFEIR